jgi:hypothetical protein
MLGALRITGVLGIFGPPLLLLLIGWIVLWLVALGIPRNSN